MKPRLRAGCFLIEAVVLAVAMIAQLVVALFG